jgi:hypothetical protein
MINSSIIARSKPPTRYITQGGWLAGVVVALVVTQVLDIRAISQHLVTGVAVSGDRDSGVHSHNNIQSLPFRIAVTES